MASNNQEAKDYVENKIAMIFGSDFIGNIGGKLYVYGKNKDGSKVQVALSMTCPKVAVEPVEAPITGFDWSDSPAPKAAEPKPQGFTDEEKANIAILLDALGL